jgi:uncharacterized protein
MPPSLSLRSRTLYFWLAWVLWLVSVRAGSAAGHVLVAIMAPERSRVMDPGSPVARLVFSLALFSNLVLPIGAVVRRSLRLSPGAKAFLVGAVLVDLAVGVVMPRFATMPGYWIWLASILTMAFAMLAVPDDGIRMTKPRTGREHPAAAAPAVGIVPGIVWAWLGCYIALTVVALVAGARPMPSPQPPLEPGAVALTTYLTDNAAVLDPAAVERLNTRLAQFERESSNQIAVAIYPKASVEPLEAFSIRLADASRLGRKGLDNGAILVVFAASRSARLEVGYGLESMLNDAKAGDVLRSALAPAWQRGDAEAAIDSTLTSIFDIVREGNRGGRAPGKLAVFRRQVAVEVPKAARLVMPAIASLNDGNRLLVAFFAAIFLTGFVDGFRQLGQLVRASARSMRDLASGRKVPARIARIQTGSLLDSLKIVVVVGGLIALGAGIVVVAGGGAFGGAGATVQW